MAVVKEKLEMVNSPIMGWNNYFSLDIAEEINHYLNQILVLQMKQ